MSFDDAFEKQLLEAYDKNARHFAQLINATIIFAVAFLAFILVPLVTLQREDARIGESLRAAKEETRKASTAQNELATAQATFAKLPEQRNALIAQQAALQDLSAELPMRIETIELSLDKVTKERGRLDELRALFNEVRAVAENLRPLDVEAFVRDLQDFLRQASDVIWGQAPLASLGFAVDCPGTNPDERANCVIRTKVMQMLATTEQDLRDRIIAPLARVDPPTAEVLESRLKKAHENFGHVLDEQPGFWQAVVYKRDVGQEFAGEIARLSDDINGAIRTKVEELAGQVNKLVETEAKLQEEGRVLVAEIGRLQESQAKLEGDIAGIEKQIATAETQIVEMPQKIEQLKSLVVANEEVVATLTRDQAKIATERQAISDRMKGVQSPFGALPIGLTEAVQVFPIIVAVGLTMALVTLAGAMRLRGRYHLLLRKKYPDEAADVDERVILTAPLFLDPHRQLKANIWRCAVLALPFAIYAISVGLIIESQRLVPQTDGASKLIESGYFWLYIVLAGLILLPLYQIGKAWSKYHPASS